LDLKNITAIGRKHPPHPNPPPLRGEGGVGVAYFY